MPILLPIAWVLLVLLAAVVLLWVAAGVTIHRSSRVLPRVGRALGLPAPPEGWPRLTVIVPMHNEEEIIETCVSGLRAQDYPNLRIILALDRCTDGTAAVVTRHAAEDPRIKMLAITQTPPGWSGKCWAMQTAAGLLEEGWVLFVDADTHMEPGLLRAGIGTALQHGFAMLGVLPELRAAKPFELIAQPVAVMQLMRIFPPAKVNRPDSTRPFGLGQFMLVRADLFKKIGGMDSFKHQIQEDVALARAIHAAGGRVGLALSGGLFSCAMYESLRDFQAGWTRIFMGCCDRNVKRLRRYAWRLLVYGLAVPLAQVLGLVTAGALLAHGARPLGLALGAMAVASLLAQVAALLRLYRMGGSPAWTVLGFPLGCLIVGRILLDGARNLMGGWSVTFGGREYVLEPRYSRRGRRA